MGAVELKSNIFKMVDGIESEQLLQTVYDFLQMRESEGKSNFWKGLTQTQKEEILLAFEDSDKEENLIEKDTFLGSL